MSADVAMQLETTVPAAVHPSTAPPQQMVAFCPDSGGIPGRSDIRTVPLRRVPA